jgi:adenylate cyclase
MAVEIERKFLVADEAWRAAADAGTRLVQGYLANTERASVRVRSAGTAAWLSVKAMVRGLSRDEFEYAIPVAEAEHLLRTLCLPPLLEKVRYRVPVAGHVWEVDEFGGDNSGLVVAEIELRAEDESFMRPAWLGAEVTAAERYYNFRLAARPFSAWTAAERAGHAP